MSPLRRSFALGLVAALAVSAAPASAQVMSKQKEIRIDLISVTGEDGAGGVGVDTGFPGTLAFGIYVNDHIAIEPQLSLKFFATYYVKGGFLGAGLFVPYYVAGDMGRTGFFVSPGLMLNKGVGDFDSEMLVDYGIDVGLKRAWKEHLTQRFALTLRDGDSHASIEYGVTAGIAFHWR